MRLVFKLHRHILCLADLHHEPIITVLTHDFGSSASLEVDDRSNATTRLRETPRDAYV